jgi:hypothetical protein
MSRLIPWFWIGLLLAGCGRYFGGPVKPVPEAQQTAHMVVQDDGSVTYVYERLEIGVKPMTDAELNRQFKLYSEEGAASINPFTYGNWKPMGDSWTPPKYTVFQLKIKNYEYPKILVDPRMAELVSESSARAYNTLTLDEILEYYYSLVRGYSGNEYRRFLERRDILRRAMYQKDDLFSGQEKDGYIVFPKLDPDVRTFTVHVQKIVLRFDYRNEPVETIDLKFRFQREVFKGYQPPASLKGEL